MGSVAHPDEVVKPPEEWEQLLEALGAAEDTRVVYLLGGIDRGKTTLCRYLAAGLRGRRRCACIDCDTGQSTIGPPTTLGMALYERGSEEPSATLLRFAESTSPRGHFMPFLAGTRRLLDRALAMGAELVLIDSPGYVEEGLAVEFQLHMIDLLAPHLVVALQRGEELEPILSCFEGDPVIRMMHLPVPAGARTRTRAERQQYREDAFRRYFIGACECELRLGRRGVHGRLPPSFRNEDWSGTLVALCDRERFVVALAIVTGVDLARGNLRLYAPGFDERKVAGIHVGSVRLRPEWFAEGVGGDARRD